MRQAAASLVSYVSYVNFVNHGRNRQQRLAHRPDQQRPPRRAAQFQGQLQLHAGTASPPIAHVADIHPIEPCGRVVAAQAERTQARRDRFSKAGVPTAHQHHLAGIPTAMHRHHLVAVGKQSEAGGFVEASARQVQCREVARLEQALEQGRG